LIRAFLAQMLVFSFAGVCVFTWPEPTVAQEAGYVFSLQLENDFFGGGTDRHFTHGTRLGCLTKPIKWMTDAADKLPWFNSERAFKESGDRLQARAGISVGQSIYTPEDITVRELINEDRPYAGWLYLGFGLVANQGSKRYDKLELDVGVVGPWSFAEEVQRNWHEFFALDHPNGWQHQLHNELGVALFYEQARRLSKKKLVHGFEFDVIPHFGGSVGNVSIHAATGLTLRLGRDLEEDFGPPRIRPSLPGGGYFRSKTGFNWYIFAGMEGRGVLHNIFLDGNTFSESHSVHKKPFVGDAQIGIAFQVHRVRISYTQIYRTREYKGQDTADQFGALSISYQS
jgi:lipid A 3-O-deacylase